MQFFSNDEDDEDDDDSLSEFVRNAFALSKATCNSEPSSI